MLESMSNEYTMLFTTVSIVAASILLRVIYSIVTKGKLPPSPIAIPILGHFHHLTPIIHQALHKISTKHGPLIHLYFGSMSCVVISSAEIAKEVLKTHEVTFSDRPNSSNAFRILLYDGAGFANSKLGNYWKFVKKLCVSELLGGRILDRQFSVRNEEIQIFLQSMSRKAKMCESVNLNVELIKLTNNIITRMCMSKRCSDTDSESDQVRNLIERTTELVGAFDISDFFPLFKMIDIQGLKRRLVEHHENFDALLEKIITDHEDQRKEGGSRGDDILHTLLDVMEDKTAEIKLSRDNIKAFMVDVLVAGTDTSAISIEWAMAELINHPDIFKKVREEIKKVVGRDRLVSELDIPNLPYLQAVVKETLRLHAPSPMNVRQSNEACKLAGYDIPAKTTVIINTWAIGRDPNHWVNPLDFCPERFTLNENDSKKVVDVRGNHYQLIPFGSGRRGCPGMSLALHVVETTLACMIQCFDWKVSGDKTVDMMEAEGFTLKRAHPVLCVPVVHWNPFP